MFVDQDDYKKSEICRDILTDIIKIFFDLGISIKQTIVIFVSR